MPYIDTAEGRMFYAARGAGPALICLHGAGGSHRHWGHVLAGLADIARVIAPDLPGHSRSDPPGRDSISGYAAAVLALLDALQLDRAVLLGHSMGGAIALELALAAPSRVAGLAFAGSSARLRVMPELIAGLERDPAATVDLLLSLMYAADAPAELRAAGRDDYLRCAPQVFRDDFAACDGFDLRGRLGELQQPALVICGAEDRLIPPKLGAELAAGLGVAPLTIAGAGHVPMIERPEATNAALRAWFAGQSW